jgi:hypothetical protein
VGPAYPHQYAGTHINRDGDADTDTDADRYADGHPHADHHAHGDLHAYADAHRHGYCDGDTATAHCNGAAPHGDGATAHSDKTAPHGHRAAPHGDIGGFTHADCRVTLVRKSSFASRSPV